jgi:hypothetical protein
MREQGAPDWMVDAMVGLEKVKAQGWAEAISPAVEKILGRSPEAVDSFLSRQARSVELG